MIQILVHLNSVSFNNYLNISKKIIPYFIDLLWNVKVFVNNGMCSLVVSVLDSPAVVSRLNSGSALLMSEKSQAVYYISSCHMLIDKALSSDKPNGHWFEADWLHCKPD